jgi:HAD superfamily hydrolase (TIGR01509 family)
MMTGLAALIFDVDGTLADTEEAHRRAFNAAFAEVGLAWAWDRALYRDLLEVTGGKERLRHYVREFHPSLLRLPEIDGVITSIHLRKTALYVDAVATGRVALRPGVSRLLAEARGAGLRLAIATTTSPANVVELIEQTLGREAIDWFDAVCAGDAVARKKPSPDVYHRVLERMRLPPEACLAFEDSANGLAASSAAGIATVVTVNAFTDDQQFSGAVAVLGDLGEPDRPFRAIDAEIDGQTYVNVDLLRRWHRGPPRPARRSTI